MPRRFPERHRYRFAEGDADILDGVVLVDIEVAFGRDLQVESTVPGDELQHVIEEPDPGADVIAAPAVELQPQRNGSFRRDPVDYAAPHKTSSSASTQRVVCSTTPVVIRAHPSQPGSPDRSRMATWRTANPPITRSRSVPNLASTKFAELCQYLTSRRSSVAHSSRRDSRTCARYHS